MIRREADASMRFLISASGALMLVTPRWASTPLHPMKTVSALVSRSRYRAIGSTRECCSRRSVPPVTTTENRGIADSSSRAMFRPFVSTTRSCRSSRAMSERAMNVVVLPTSRMRLSPDRTRLAAALPISCFSTAEAPSDSSNDGSSCSLLPTGTAPPRTRRMTCRLSSTSRSARTVTSEIPNFSLKSDTRTKLRSVTSASISSRRISAGIASIGDDISESFEVLRLLVNRPRLGFR